MLFIRQRLLQKYLEIEQLSYGLTPASFYALVTIITCKAGHWYRNKIASDKYINYTHAILEKYLKFEFDPPKMRIPNPALDDQILLLVLQTMIFFVDLWIPQPKIDYHWRRQSSILLSS